MSMKTWKARYYLSGAKYLENYTAELSDNQLKIAALHHSLRKWTGLLASNLKRHKLRVDVENNIVDAYYITLHVDSNSCSLCTLYLRDGCEDCPIARDGDELTQSIYIGCNHRHEAWQAWVNKNNPKPMIARLKKELKLALKAEFEHMKPMYASLPKSDTFDRI